MTVKYKTHCSKSDVYVLEKEDGFHLTIGSRVNPLSFGNKLAEFDTMGQAIDAAEHFCRLYAIAVEHGYHLAQDEFRKDGYVPIPVRGLLNLKLSDSEMRILLAKEKLLYGT